MEIVYTNENGKMNNFNYYTKLFDGKEMMYSFELWESISRNKTNCEDVKFVKEIQADLYLVYPLQVVVKETISFRTLHELISKIRKVYKEVYSKAEECGIWGHSIHDLTIEGLEIYKDGDQYLIKLSIGS